MKTLPVAQTKQDRLAGPTENSVARSFEDFRQLQEPSCSGTPIWNEMNPYAAARLANQASCWHEPSYIQENLGALLKRNQLVRETCQHP